MISEQAGADPAVAQRGDQARASEPSPSGLAAGVRSVQSDQPDADDADRAEHELVAREVGQRRRSPGRAARRRSPRPSRSRSAAPRCSRGAAPASQAIAPAHDGRAADALHEAGDVEHHDVVGERERDARQRSSARARAARSACTPTRAAIQPPGRPPDERPHRDRRRRARRRRSSTGRTGRSGRAAAA